MKANRKFIQDKTAVSPGMVGGLVALLITIIVGILVYWSLSTGINPNLAYTNANNATNAQINTSHTNIDTMSSTVFGLLPIIALVVVASLILGVVIGFGREGGGGL